MCSAEKRGQRGTRGLGLAGRVGLALLLGCATGLAPSAHAQGEKSAEMKRKIRHLKSMAPYLGYLEAHQGEKKPLELLGGPIDVTVKQESGGVFVALPDNRRLDPAVFGHPGMERAFAGTPGINGVPLPARGSDGGQYTRMKRKSPFGDKYVVMGKGKLMLHAVDRTATDAAVTKDSVKFKAEWQDKKGNTYAVLCCKMLAAHGTEFPTFGGVATNHILHGSSRLGTSLMPTEFTYVDFWGMGAVNKNRNTLDKPRLIHGMLTEYVRTSGYQLGFDRDITPTRLQFHLMVPPFLPDPEHHSFREKPVATGFELPNGKTLPFWHVMFETLEVKAKRG